MIAKLRFMENSPTPLEVLKPEQPSNHTHRLTLLASPFLKISIGYRGKNIAAFIPTKSKPSSKSDRYISLPTGT